MRGLIVAGSPEPSSKELLARLHEEADYTIAADRGAALLHAAKIVPDLFCGDEDSIGPETRAWVASARFPEERFPWKKDDTDLGLAFRFAELEATRREEPLDLVVTCASGGRADHALGVFGVLAEHAGKIVSAGGSLALEEDAFLCRILPAGSSWQLGPRAQHHTFSALSLAERSRITEVGMLWSVEHSDLGLLDDRGVSNRIESGDAAILCEEGMVAAFLLKDAHEGEHAGERQELGA